MVARSVAAHIQRTGPGSAAFDIPEAEFENMSEDDARQLFRKMAEIATTPSPEDSLEYMISRYFVHEFHSDSEAADILYDKVFERDLELTALIVSKIRNVEPESEEAKVAALMLISQVSFIFGPLSTPARRLGWKKIGQRESELIINNIWID